MRRKADDVPRAGACFGGNGINQRLFATTKSNDAERRFPIALSRGLRYGHACLEVLGWTEETGVNELTTKRRQETAVPSRKRVKEP